MLIVLREFLLFAFVFKYIYLKTECFGSEIVGTGMIIQ